MRIPTKERLRLYRKDPTYFIEDQFITEEGRPLQLMDWQKEYVIKPVFLDRLPNGSRRVKRAIIGLPTGNGKTSLAAGLATWQLYCDEPGEIYGAANSRDQASIILDDMDKTLKRNPNLAKSAKTYRDAIEIVTTGSVFKVMSAEHIVAHGIRPRGVYFDEVHGQRSEKLYEVFWKSTIKIRDSLLYMTSTAGDVKNSFLYGLYREIIMDNNLDESQDLIIFKGQGQKYARTYMFWSFVNLLTTVITPEALEEYRASMHPIAFQRWHQNRWVAEASAFLPRELVESCLSQLLEERFQGRKGYRYIYAIDLGLKRDRTARVIAHREEDGIIVNDSLKVWRGTPADPVSIAEVEEDMLWAARNFPNLEFVCDPWQMQSTIQRLKGQGYRVREFNFTSASIQRLSSSLYSIMASRKLRTYHHPLLIEELNALQYVSTSYGFRFDHTRTGHSDTVIALAMAVSELLNENRVSMGLMEWLKKKAEKARKAEEEKRAKEQATERMIEEGRRRIELNEARAT